ADSEGNHALSALPSAAACSWAAAHDVRVCGFRHSARFTAAGNVNAPPGMAQSWPEGSVRPAVSRWSADSVRKGSGGEPAWAAPLETHMAIVPPKIYMTGRSNCCV